MMYEVELKAHVEDPEGMKALLDRDYEFKSRYDKKDIYYAYPPSGSGDRAGEGKSFRVRVEGSDCIVTAKEKHVSKGVETNLEREFSVSSPELFGWFVSELGCRQTIRKRKRGYRYERGDITLELSEVEGLGWFLEIEKLCPGTDGGVLEAARGEILSVLEEVGIPQTMIEPRYYTDMLKELGENKGDEQSRLS